jgi:ATP-dependent Clp protease ATP-binding subunit ClpC
MTEPPAVVASLPKELLRALEGWLERDLTAAAAAGELGPAFESDAPLRRVIDVLGSQRFPVLVGESGVGKTTLVHEVARRQVAPTEAAHDRELVRLLGGRRIVQLSIKAKLSGLPRKDKLGHEMQALVEKLVAHQAVVAPFFRDLSLAYAHDLEPQLEVLGLRFKAPLLGEGERATIDRMIEHAPDLEQCYLPLEITEPDAERMGRILVAFSEVERARGRTYSDEARRTAYELSERFLSRSRQPRKTLELLMSVGALTKTAVGRGDVLARFEESYRVPRFLIDPTVPFEPEAAERHFTKRVLGQLEAARAVVRMVGLIKAGLSDTRRPFGTFLFVGPTGVGKTHLAQLLAEYLFGSRERLIRLNMADYQQPADALTLFGNPHGYTLRDQRGLLHARVAGHPFAVLLLDELEKASEKVHDRFLQLFDEGVFINGASETVPCRSLIVIATSNAGAEVYRGQPLGFGSKPALDVLDRELDRLLFKHFRFEFLNRFDQVVHFHPLGRDDIRAIALREIEALERRPGLAGRGVRLETDEGLLDWLVAHGYDPHYGARFLRRTIERDVTTAVAEVLVREPLDAGARVRLRVRGDRPVASLAPRAPEPRAEPVTLAEGASTRVVSLDKRGLVHEAEALVTRAAPLLEGHEARLEQASRRLAEMGVDGFWGDRLEARRVLDDYRALDVVLEQEKRHRERLLELVDALARARERSDGAKSLAQALERASRAVREWEAELRAQGRGRLWLSLHGTDPLHRASELLVDMTEMYLGWARHLGLACEVVAVSLAEDALTRVVLSVEGRGAEWYLEMEEGLHRQVRERGDLRVQVCLVGAELAPESKRGVTVVRVSPRGGLVPRDVTYELSARIESADTGAVLDLLGNDREVLERAAADLRAAKALTRPEGELVRVYGQGGVGARDPRTRAVVARYKDVVRGRLDALFEAYQARSTS